jgi:hypothetical protein
MEYSKVRLQSGGGEAFSCFRPCWIGRLSDKCVPLQGGLRSYVLDAKQYFETDGFI